MTRFLRCDSNCSLLDIISLLLDSIVLREVVILYDIILIVKNIVVDIVSSLIGMT